MTLRLLLLLLLQKRVVHRLLLHWGLNPLGPSSLILHDFAVMHHLLIMCGLLVFPFDFGLHLLG